ncbi:hypothetical protein TeGR_g13140 [Tetraparma gracilis]|uniref:Uncharacterized protein n=1 Tax=Tetraparma gracilis TaxID=2962635 RepID=A0ABQ6MKE8_9STRA|nr:hypothetical protein TeGR_g13140 [Tetraparma gracilis]
MRLVPLLLLLVELLLPPALPFLLPPAPPPHPAAPLRAALRASPGDDLSASLSSLLSSASVPNRRRAPPARSPLNPPNPLEGVISSLNASSSPSPPPPSSPPSPGPPLPADPPAPPPLSPPPSVVSSYPSPATDLAATALGLTDDFLDEAGFAGNSPAFNRRLLSLNAPAAPRPPPATASDAALAKSANLTAAVPPKPWRSPRASEELRSLAALSRSLGPPPPPKPGGPLCPECGEALTEACGYYVARHGRCIECHRQALTSSNAAVNYGGRAVGNPRATEPGRPPPPQRARAGLSQAAYLASLRSRNVTLSPPRRPRLRVAFGDEEGEGEVVGGVAFGEGGEEEEEEEEGGGVERSI